MVPMHLSQSSEEKTEDDVHGWLSNGTNASLFEEKAEEFANRWRSKDTAVSLYVKKSYNLE